MILVSKDYYNGTRTPENLSFCVPNPDSHVAAWFAGDEQMGGDCHGYDGPYPPWNNRAILRDIVTLYALEIGRLPVTGRFSGQNVIQVMNEYILDTVDILGKLLPESRYCVA